MSKNSVTLHNTFAEAFPMKASRLIVTAYSKKWALEAANSFTGFATSVIACGCEAGIEAVLNPKDTPDGRPGVSLLVFSMSEKELAKQIGVSTFNSKSNGLSNEVTEFIELSNSFSSWAICHADLPYLNKYNISVYLQEIAINEIVISKSSDNGTPLVGGCAFFENFRYGENSFKKHVVEFEKLNLSYKQVFNKELYFELDNENDYLEFLKTTSLV